MQYYFAPLEGLTDSTYRRLHHQFFGGPHRYYTPFFSPTVHRALTAREERELPRADTVDFSVVPQILTKSAEDFIWLAGVCRDFGYDEINLNLGCPSGTVTAKGKGSGMLRDPDTLDCFLYDIFAKSPLPISVKTRIGFEKPEEWAQLLAVYNRYPIKELIIHPRIRTAFYNGPVDMAAFRYAMEKSRAPVCYNGSLCTRQDIADIAEQFPDLQGVMLGRGLIADPGLLTPGGTDVKTLETFHNALLTEYMRTFGSERNAMFRMKENWRYWLCKFGNSQKLGKQLRKATHVQEYKAITQQIFRTLPLLTDIRPIGIKNHPRLSRRQTRVAFTILNGAFWAYCADGHWCGLPA